MTVLFAALLLLPAGWGTLALWYQAASRRPLRYLAAAAWLLLSAALLAAGAFDRSAVALLLFV
ncbi:MAG: DUF4105 domain-containing protein, partial [Steroidobacteraceae bacterium]